MPGRAGNVAPRPQKNTGSVSFFMYGELEITLAPPTPTSACGCMNPLPARASTLPRNPKTGAKYDGRSSSKP